MAKLGWLLPLIVLAGCRPASPYGPVKPPPRVEPAKPAPGAVPQHYTWLPPGATRDVPLLFVSADSQGWAKFAWDQLPGYWNPSPHAIPGLRTLHLGLPSLQAYASLLAHDGVESVRIKVPLGLPDPRPSIPAANPPTLGKWNLGKKIFHDKLLTSGGVKIACAGCHHPEKGYAEEGGLALYGERNTLSLLNVVYNTSQFWDGRVVTLEEVIVRDLQDEASPPEKWPARRNPEVTHRWGGLVKALAADEDYVRGFEQVFGIAQPTQDAIAKAIATYLRTLLSGESLYDLAERERLSARDEKLTAKHFVKALTPEVLKKLDLPDQKPERIAVRLESGHHLFFGKAGCAACHKAPLFTDHAFHNTGVAVAERYLDDPKQVGRFAVAPPGLKETRLIGAFRTPTLRNLPRTGPYFHDGSAVSLVDVVVHYDQNVFATPYLSRELRAGRDEKNKLNLTNEEGTDLVLFLHSLNGK